MIPLRLTEALHARTNPKPGAAIQNRRRKGGRGRARSRAGEEEKGEGALLDWSGLQAWQVMHSANWWIATAGVAAIGGARAGPVAEARSRERGGGVKWRPREDRQERSEPSRFVCKWVVFQPHRRPTPAMAAARAHFFFHSNKQGKNFYDGLP
nr:unnamed protein product [Digitaria exilis]